MSILKHKSELLFLYDIKDANPNGDPLDENKPRIDEETGQNLVTDVRLKRTVRDYLFNYKRFDGKNGGVTSVGAMYKNQVVREEGCGRGCIPSPAQVPDLLTGVEIIPSHVVPPVDHHLPVGAPVIEIGGGPGGDLIPGCAPDLLPGGHIH